MTDARFNFPGDACLSVDLAASPASPESTNLLDPGVNARCVALAAALERERRTGVRDVVPGFHSVSVYFDPLQVNRDALAADIQRLSLEGPLPPAKDAAPLEIPVHYGGESGPDLAAVAEFGGCSQADAIRIHSEAVYRVYMLGFLPGFAYLGSVDRRISMPRLDTPRVKVAAGSVGIAGVQTAIYPCDTPGGWRIIGRTSIATFDPAQASPSLFTPGQRVKFVAV
jgi:inhibitor of KinA